MTSIHQVVALGILFYLIMMLIVRARYPRLPAWSIMASAMFVVVISDLVPPDEVSSIVDWNVILFLIGMFSLVAVAEHSGVLSYLSLHVVSLFRTTHAVICALALLFGFLAAIAVNDTIALMGLPIAYHVARALRVKYNAMFLLLAFSITIGSTTTPIGNPQNILIATGSGLKAPFILLLKYLLIPTVLNLLVTAHIVIRVYRIKDKPVHIGLVAHETIRDKRDAVISTAALAVTVTTLVANDLLALSGLPNITNVGAIPFVVACIAYLLIRNPRHTLAKVDWGTIVFFISMFIVMDGIWRAGVLQDLLRLILPTAISGFYGLLMITLASILFSQVLSNVPFVKLFINYMKDLGYTGEDALEWTGLAMASTIAGNLTILGAASNVIIIEALESRYRHTITYKEFMKLGALTTIVNLLIYILYMPMVSLL